MKKIWSINDILKPLSELTVFAFPIRILKTMVYITHMTKSMEQSLFEQSTARLFSTSNPVIPNRGSAVPWGTANTS